MTDPDSDPVLERVRALRIEWQGNFPDLRRDVVPPELRDLVAQAEVLGATDDGVRGWIGDEVPESYLDTLRNCLAGRRRQIDAWLQASVSHEVEHQSFMALLELVDETEPLTTPVPSIAEQDRRPKLPDGVLRGILDRARRNMDKRGGGQGEDGSE